MENKIEKFGNFLALTGIFITNIESKSIGQILGAILFVLGIYIYVSSDMIASLFEK
jgi:hypothetical protein